MTQLLKRMLEIRRERRALKRVPGLACKEERLLSDKEVNLQEILGSEKIEREWNAIRPELEILEISDKAAGVNPGDRRAIFYLLSYFKPRSVLEIGTHIGASTLHIAMALNRSRAENEGHSKFVSVDVCDVNNPILKPWLEHGTRYSAAEIINKTGCGSFVEFVTNNSLAYMAQCKQKYDFIFLDGDHAARTVYQEIPAALELLKENGLILLHDYFPELRSLWSDGAMIAGPFLAMDRLSSEGSQLKILPLGHLPWPTKLGSNITSLALLVRKSCGSTGVREGRTK